MAARRKDDAPISRTRFRTERLLQDGGCWFFLTREGTVEGPFGCRADAVEQLANYLALVQSGMLPEGAGAELELKLDPMAQNRTRERSGLNFHCWSRDAGLKSA